jgi:DNA replication protein DnaC
MTVSTPRRPGPDLSEIELDTLLKRLHLANLRRVFREAIARAEEEQWSYRDFLALLVAEEVAHRKQTRLQRLTRRARFPYLKTIEDFDFTLQSNLRVALLGSYLGPDFVTEGRSLVFHGQTGRGKTHLAVAIGYRAIQNGFETLFTTAAHLIEDLSNAGRHGRLHEALETYTHPHVLVIDEVGYLTYGPDAANVLYHVVNDRHLRRRPMVFTTNKPLNQWGRVLHDPDLAAAILDRVLERGRWITLDGPSGRTRHLKLETAVPQDADGARFSGKPVPEFPEPTTRRRRGRTCWNTRGHSRVCRSSCSRIVWGRSPHVHGTAIETVATFPWPWSALHGMSGVGGFGVMWCESRPAPLSDHPVDHEPRPAGDQVRRGASLPR